MPFTVRVYCREARHRFPIAVSGDSISAEDLKALIQGDPSGRDIGFSVGSWGIFSADNDGKKVDGELADEYIISNETKVWVERLQAPGAYLH